MLKKIIIIAMLISSVYILFTNYVRTHMETSIRDPKMAEAIHAAHAPLMNSQFINIPSTQIAFLMLGIAIILLCIRKKT